MSAGYVESHVRRGVTQAYLRMSESPHGVPPALLLPRTPWYIARELRRSQFAMSRLIVTQLNALFMGDAGRMYGAVLSVSTRTFLVGDIKGRMGVKRYRLGSSGPYNIVVRKKGRFFRKVPPPQMVPVGFEELCYYFDPREVYRMVYQSLHLAAQSILESEG